MDKAKYEWGRRYALLILSEWQTKSVKFLIKAVDMYRNTAYKNKSAFDLGLADQLWDWVLKKEYKEAIL